MNLESCESCPGRIRGEGGGGVNRVVHHLLRTARVRLPEGADPATVATAADPIALAVARSAACAMERWGGFLDQDDMVQEARVGILLGIREWDPARGRLDAWLARRAYQAAVDAIRQASRRQEEYLADRLEEADDDRPLAEVLADPRQDPEEAMDRQPRHRLAWAIAREARRAGQWAEEALDRLVEAHEAGDEPAAQRLRERLAPVVAAAMTTTIRDTSAAALRQRRRQVA